MSLAPGLVNTVNKHLLHTVRATSVPPREGWSFPQCHFVPPVAACSGCSVSVTPTCFHGRGYRPCASSSVLPVTSLLGASQQRGLLPFLRAATFRLDLLSPLPLPFAAAVRPSSRAVRTVISHHPNWSLSFTSVPVQSSSPTTDS